MAVAFTPLIAACGSAPATSSSTTPTAAAASTAASPTAAAAAATPTAAASTAASPTAAAAAGASPTAATSTSTTPAASTTPVAAATPNTSIKAQMTFSWWGTGERNTKTQAVIDLFQKAYPNVSVQGTSVGDFTTYWQKLTVQAAAHGLPDVPQMQTRYMSAYDTRGALRVLDDLIASPGQIDVSGVPKVTVDAGRGPDGKLYMISTGSATDNWMYNDTMVTNAGLASPTTLTTFDAIQTWLLSAKDKLPKGVYPSDLLGDDDTVWWAWISSQGQPVFAKDGTLGFPKQTMIDYWNWWEKLRTAGATVTASMRSEEPTSNVQTYLATGKAMFAQAPANQLGAYQTALTTGKLGTMKISMFPKTSAGNGQVLVTNGMSIAANTKVLDAAAAFVNFFTNDPAAAAVYASDNGTVTVTKLLDAQIAQPNIAASQKEYLQFLKAVIASEPTIVDFPANYNAVVLALKNNYSNVSFGKATVSAAVDAFFTQANAAAKSS